MNRKLFSEKFGEIPPAEVIPIPLEGYEVPLEPFSSAIWEGGYYFFQDLDWPVRVRYSNYQLEQDDQFRIVEEGPVMALQFILGNSFYGDWEGVGRRIDHEASYNFFYVPYLEQQLEGYEADRVYSKIELQYPMELLHSLAPQFPLLERLLEKAEQGKSSLLHATNQIAPSEMLSGVRNILYNSFPYGAKAMFGEARGITTLITALDAFERQKVPSPPQRLTHYEVEQVYQAKDILIDNMDTPFTLTELSLMVGTNMFKLNSGFKEVYGVTIFDFLLNARMDRARYLLVETGMEIEFVALLTGYSDIKEFTLVFKKYYGASPRSYRARPLHFMLQKHRPKS